MAETYTSKYANGEAVDAALDKAESAVQPGDLGTAAAADVGDFATAAQGGLADSALQPGDVVNALDSTATDVPLSAAQGKALADGKVTGPASATDNAIARFDGETGKLLQDGANATLADNGALTLATGAVTDSQPMLNLSQTWNDASDTFTGIKANITDTASASGSLLLDLQVGGVSRFNIGKTGNASVLNTLNVGGTAYANGTINVIANNAGTRISLNSNTNSIYLGSVGKIQFAQTVDSSGTVDLIITRDGAQILAQRNSTNAQEFRLYGSYTSDTAYQRLSTKTLREAVTCAAGASVTTTISIPKFTHLIGVTTRVTTAIGTTNSTTGYQVGDGTDADLWGAITGTAQGTTSDRRDFTAVDALGPDDADRTITLTAVGGNFDGTGVIEVCAYYLAAEAD